MAISLVTNAQVGQSTKQTTPGGVDEAALWQHFLQHHPDGNGWDEFIASRKQDHINNQNSSNAKLPFVPVVNLGCTNIDFEDGTLNGWTASTGYNPAYNTAGCCATAGGAQVITNGAAVDACGGFPVVAPGGSFSLKLGDNNVNGIADRIEQTFNVTANQTFFTYSYAVVLQDPGHTAADQPSFQIDMIDGNGNQVPCAQYQVSAGQGIPGFQNSTSCAGVIYKPWTTIIMDLSGYLGQAVTIRFTTYDCSLGGHYAYAYIDGSCLQYNTSINDTVCNNSTLTLNGFPGAGSYLWSGPGVAGATTPSVVINSSGNYSVSSISVSGCPLPNINYDINNVPAPVASFVASNTISCNNSVSFVNTTNYSGGNAGSSYWSFGDGTTSMLDNPTHTFPGPGTYQVQLIAYSGNGCSDTTFQNISIMLPLSCSFSYTGNCALTPAQFTDNSYVAGGTIVSWYWNFGDGTSSSQQNPLHIYANAGTYNVVLYVTSSNGCSGSDTMQVTVSPVPQVSFLSNNVCFGQVTQFTNTSTIPSGNIISYAWDFDSNGNTDNTSQNPGWTFPSSGNMNVTLIAVSNNNCSASWSGPVTVYSQPTASFSANNSCEGQATPFINNSYVVAPGAIVSFNWDFGDMSSSSLVNPSHAYATYGNYNVVLTATTTDGCVGTYANSITVYPVPQPSFTAPAVCKNLPTQFNNTSSIANGTITGYAWDFTNDGSTDNISQNPNFVYSADGTFNAELTVVSNFGCVATLIHPVSVYPAPNTNFVVSSSCFGTSTVFTDQSTISSGSIIARHWDFDSNGSIDAVTANPIYVYPTAGMKSVSLYTWSNNMCQSLAQKVVYVNPTPQVNFTTTDPEGCPAHCTSFNSLSYVTSGSIVDYNWDFGDNSEHGQGVTPSHCFESGVYDVTLTATTDSGCTASVTLNDAVTVYARPVAGFSWNPFDPDVLDPFVSIDDNSVNADHWWYDFSDGTTDTMSNPQHTFNTEQPDSFEVTQIVWTDEGCYDTIKNVINVKPGYAIYFPNAFTPNNDGINEIFKGAGVGIMTFKMWIYDRWGNKIFYSEDMEEGWDGRVEGGGSGNIAQRDVYVWKAVVKDLNEKEHKLMGHVTLVR